MKKIIFAGMVLILAGCSHTISGLPAAEPIVQEGWYSQQKTELQLSQDMTECKTRCASA